MSRPTSAELREKCLEAGDRVRELRELDPSKRSDNWSADLRATVAALDALDHEFSVAWQAEKYAAERAAFEAAIATGGKGPEAATGELRGQPQSWGAQFIASQAYTERRDGRTDAVEVRTLLSTEKSDPAGGLFMPVGSPFLGNQRQARLFIEDVIPSAQTALNSIPYIRETTPATYEIGASSVSEAGLKPEVTMKFTSVDAPVRKIAAWIPVTNELLDDAPAMMGYIDARLAYMVRLRREQQILNGSGTSPQLTGIYNSSIATSSTGADKISRIGVAVGVIEAVDGYPDAVAISPTEYWAIMTARSANQFDGGFSTGLPFGSTPTTLWGLPAIRTRSVASNKALVGDFGQGAQVFNREGVTIKVTDSHDDYFVYNKTVVLAETRLALAVYRPDFFCDVTLS